MESYCLKCKKHTFTTCASTSNGKVMILSKCAICVSTKSRSRSIIK